MPLPTSIHSPSQIGQSGERMDSRQQYSLFWVQQRSSSIDNPDYVSLLKREDLIGRLEWDQSSQRK
uniref:Uncharacterized protein n=1 Tax=Romanomermis culicivorax TaxID=13658 RepID=A0A915J6F0_ROMCU